jgi:hypothetical protein
MTYTLAAAAKATGLNKWMVLRLIRSGEITGTKDLFGDWHVDPDELHQLYPPVEAHGAGNDEASPPTVPDAASLPTAPDAASLETEIATLVREAEDLHRKRPDDARHDQTEHDTDQRSRRPWWRRLAG